MEEAPRSIVPILQILLQFIRSFCVLSCFVQGPKVVKEPVAKGDPAVATEPTSIILIRVSLHSDFLFWLAILWGWRALRIVHWSIFAVTAYVLRIARIVTTATSHMDPQIAAWQPRAPWRPLPIRVPYRACCVIYLWKCLISIDRDSSRSSPHTSNLFFRPVVQGSFWTDVRAPKLPRCLTFPVKVGVQAIQMR